MNRWLAFLALVVVANAQALSPEQMTEVKFDQKLGSQVPLDAEFQHETGRVAKLGDAFGKRPVVMILGYYECPMLCTLVGNGLVAALADLKFEAGDQFNVVWVSIDPEEAPLLAAAKKRNYLRLYERGRPDAWHFLTGEERSIQRVAKAVGFGYRYDPEIDQYAHPSGIVVLTSEGRVSRYLLGVNYSPNDLRLAIMDASGKRIGSLADQLLLLCYHFNPLRGKYGPTILITVRVLGAVTVCALGGAAFLLIRRERRSSP